jgi:heme/copper-type cytochrome/quinol oxidase subunit 2
MCVTVLLRRRFLLAVAVDGVEQKLHLHVNERVKAIECNDMMHGFCIPSCSAFNL